MQGKRRAFLKKSSKIAALSLVVNPLTYPLMAQTANFKTRKDTQMQYITLNNGVKMPTLGYGTFQIPPQETQKCVETALELGYPLIDTAQSYFNEAQVGAALKTALKGGIKRENLFITTKLWVSYVSEEGAYKAFEDSLKKLGLDYLDLYLIHQPYNDIYGAWRAMSKLYKEGRIRAIGVSNFYPNVLVDFALYNEIKPAINQIETHPFFQREYEQKIHSKYGIATNSWASFAEGRNHLFENAVLKQIAQKHNKSVAQVVLRWLVERGIVVIPKSVRKERMQENINIFDFKLDNADKKAISTLDTGKSLFFDHRDVERVEWFYDLIKERNL